VGVRQGVLIIRKGGESPMEGNLMIRRGKRL